MVWSVSGSGRMPRASISGRISAALPSRPTETGWPVRRSAMIVERLVDARRRACRDSRCAAASRSGSAGIRSRGSDAPGHDGRQRLRAAHAAQAGGQDPPALQIAAIMLAAHLDEGLVGALNDALRADIDPRAGGHLAVHRQPLAIERVEMLPARPMRHQVGVGEQHARRIRHGCGTRRPGLPDWTSSVWSASSRLRRRGDDPVEALPVARRAADAAIDDQLPRPLGNLGVEVVHQHRAAAPR